MASMAENIQWILENHVSQILAKSAIDVHVLRLGKTADELEPSDLPKLASFLSKGLLVYVGEAIAKEIETQIRNLE